MLGKVDDLVSYLMESLYTHNLHDCVNLILLADHGTALYLGVGVKLL